MVATQYRHLIRPAIVADISIVFKRANTLSHLSRGIVAPHQHKPAYLHYFTKRNCATQHILQHSAAHYNTLQHNITYRIE